MTKIILPNRMVIARVENGTDDDQKLVGRIVTDIESGFGHAVVYLEELSGEFKISKCGDENGTGTV